MRHMALCEIHLSQGNALRKMTSIMALLPEGKPGPWPVLYLLHGLSDDHTAWQRWTSIERYVRDLPLMVVMPNGERGWYTDSASDPNSAYETLITRDIINFVDATFQTIANREGRVIAGLSMGGYGALKLALKHPDIFRAAASHSGAVEIATHISDQEGNQNSETVRIFGPNPSGGTEDVFALAKNASPETRPALRIDCGVDDFLIEHNRRFHAYLDEISCPHEYAEHPGGHDWGYWDLHIQDTIRFFSEVLAINR